MTVYDFKNNLSPVYISVIYTLNSSLVVKTRRSADSFIESTYMKKISRKSILYLGFKIWNRFYRNIKTSTIINSFKHALKKQFLKTRFFYSIFYFLFLLFFNFIFWRYYDILIMITKIIITIKAAATFIINITYLFLYSFIYFHCIYIINIYIFSVTRGDLNK